MRYIVSTHDCRSAYARNGKRGYELKLKEQTFSRLLCSALELVAFVERRQFRLSSERRPSPRSQASWHTCTTKMSRFRVGLPLQLRPRRLQQCRIRSCDQAGVMWQAAGTILSSDLWSCSCCSRCPRRHTKIHPGLSRAM